MKFLLFCVRHEAERKSASPSGLTEEQGGGGGWQRAAEDAGEVLGKFPYAKELAKEPEANSALLNSARSVPIRYVSSGS